MTDSIRKFDDMTADDRQFISDIRAIIVFTAKEKAYQAADTYQVVSNRLVCRRSCRRKLECTYA